MRLGQILGQYLRKIVLFLKYLAMWMAVKQAIVKISTFK